MVVILIIGAPELGVSCVRVPSHWPRPFEVRLALYIEHDFMYRFGEYNVHLFVTILTNFDAFLCPFSLRVVKFPSSTFSSVMSSNSYGSIIFHSSILVHPSQ